MSNLLKRLVFLLAGVAPFGAIAFILHWTQWTFMSWTMFRVVPYGALFLGALGASGFLLAARRLDIRASKWGLLSVVSCAVSTYFLVSFLQYRVYSAMPGGALVPFHRYLDLSIRTSRRVRDEGSEQKISGSLGGKGYYYVFLQLAGLTLGSSCTFLSLFTFKYCRECSRYYTRTARNTRYFYSKEHFSVNALAVKALLESGAIIEGLSLLSATGRPAQKASDAPFWASTQITRCPGCNRRQLTYSAGRRNADGKSETIEQLSLNLDLPAVGAEQSGAQTNALSAEVFYELSRDGVFYGPYTQSQLRQHLKDRNILLTDRVRRCDSGAWHDVSTVLTL